MFEDVECMDSYNQMTLSSYDCDCLMCAFGLHGKVWSVRALGRLGFECESNSWHYVCGGVPECACACIGHIRVVH